MVNDRVVPRYVQVALDRVFGPVGRTPGAMDAWLVRMEGVVYDGPVRQYCGTRVERVADLQAFAHWTGPSGTRWRFVLGGGR